MNCARIEAWWSDSKVIIPTNVPRIQQIWFCWWVKKSTHLAYYLMNELDCEEEALMPTTNLVENVHIHPYMCGFLLEMVAR
jgi:hypothetical protein